MIDGEIVTPAPGRRWSWTWTSGAATARTPERTATRTPRTRTHGDGDRESVAVWRPTVGKPVDPDDDEDSPAGLPRLSGRTRKPIVPRWLKSKAELVTVARWAANDVGYIAGYHAARVPKYAGKTAFYAPLGGGPSARPADALGHRRGGQLVAAAGRR